MADRPGVGFDVASFAEFLGLESALVEDRYPDFLKLSASAFSRHRRIFGESGLDLPDLTARNGPTLLLDGFGRDLQRRHASLGAPASDLLRSVAEDAARRAEGDMRMLEEASGGFRGAPGRGPPRRDPEAELRLAQMLGFHLSACRKTADRLLRARDSIREIFGDGPSIAIEPRNLGDVHEDSSFVFRFAIDGEKYIFKPRSACAEIILERSFGFLRRRGVPVPRIPDTVYRRDFHIQPDLDGGESWGPDALPGEFTRRVGSQIGALIALGWVLGLGDINFENYKIDGVGLLLFDNEVMASAPVRRPAGFSVYNGSVLDAYDLFPLKMCILPHLVKFHSSTHDFSLMNRLLTQLGAQDVEVTRQVTEQVRWGMERCYDVLARDGRDLLSEIAGLIEAVDDRHRWIARATVDYGHLATVLADPVVAGDERATAVVLAALAGAVEDQPWFEQLLGFEAGALVEREVPAFYRRLGDDGLLCRGGHVIDHFFPATGFEGMAQRLEKIPEVRRAHDAAVGAFVGIRSEEPRGPYLISPRASGSATPVAAAGQVGDLLLSLGLACGGRPYWPTIQVLEDGRWTGDITSYSLYDGSAGVGYFLWRLGQVAGDSKVREQGRAFLLGSLDVLAENVAGPGLLGGRAGLIHALEAADLDLPRRHDDLLERSAVAAFDEALDQGDLEFAAGAAGVALVLLAHFDPGRPAIRMRIEAFRDRLVATAGQEPFTGFANRHFDLEVVRGFAHGESGIAAVLATAAARLGCPRARRVAVDAMAREMAGLESVAARDPLRVGHTAERDISWCFGASGVGYALAHVASVCDEPALLTGRNRCREAIAAASGRTQGLGLCHGIGSLLEFDAFRYRDQALAAIMADTGWAEPLAEPATLQWTYSPGLMLGLAGVGYSLLRCERPDRVPRLFELPPG